MTNGFDKTILIVYKAFENPIPLEKIYDRINQILEEEQVELYLGPAQTLEELINNLILDDDIVKTSDEQYVLSEKGKKEMSYLEDKVYA